MISMKIDDNDAGADDDDADEKQKNWVASAI